MNKNLTELIKCTNEKSWTVSHPKYYVNICDDIYNKKLYNEYKDLICKKYFVCGTIFFTPIEIFDKVNDFFMKYYKYIIYNNLYDCNYINKDCSYIHFIERLYGIIQYSVESL
jgi:hypothetical protein